MHRGGLLSGGTVDDLVQFLRDRLDEDEQIARAATEGPWVAEVSGETGHCVIPADAQSTREFVAKTQLYAAAFDAEHIAAHNPARALREIDAKRQIIARYVEHERLDRETFDAEGQHARSLVSLRAAYLDAVRELAAVYSDRPGYREEWRP
jgi:hypothetical protein